MKLTKKERDKLFKKYDGKCSYCGIQLPVKWHADHIKPIVRDWIKGGCERPENDNFQNMTPSCPSCNIIKGSLQLESFRDVIKGFIVSLNRDSTQYRFAKKYNLIKEIDIEVKFYFELHNESDHSD